MRLSALPSPLVARALLVTMMLGAMAHAEPSPAEKAAAENLFQEARKLSRDNKHAEACPKYEESNRIDPSLGTQLYLADCYEKTNRLASAWAIFKEAASFARTSGQADREKSASARADALEARLPRLTFKIAAPDTPGLEIRQDGRTLIPALWSTATPIDSGKHKIEVSAKGFKTWSTTVDAVEGQTATVSVPPLVAEAANVPATSATSTASSAPPTTPTSSAGPGMTVNEETVRGWSTQKKLAVAAGGVGVVGAVLGTVFALKARSQWSDSRPLCPNDRCKPEGYDLATSAQDNGNRATLFAIIGGVGLGAGAVLWFTAPGGNKATALGVGPGAFSVRGAW